jgi:hypothetical protein
MSWRGGVVKVVASVAAVVTLACGAAFGQADRR